MSRKTGLILLLLAGAMSVGAKILEEQAKENTRERERSLARARMAVESAAAIIAAETRAAAPAASQRRHVSLLAPAGATDGAKRAGPALCAYHSADDRRVGRAVSARLAEDGATELVRILVDAAYDPTGAVPAGTERELPAPDSVRVDACQR